MIRPIWNGPKPRLAEPGFYCVGISGRSDPSLGLRQKKHMNETIIFRGMERGSPQVSNQAEMVEMNETGSAIQDPVRFRWRGIP
jgi:hypothetical protein